MLREEMVGGWDALLHVLRPLPEDGGTLVQVAARWYQPVGRDIGPVKPFRSTSQLCRLQKSRQLS